MHALSLDGTMTSATALHPSLLAIRRAEAQFKGEQELLSVNSPRHANYLKGQEGAQTMALLSLGLSATEQCPPQARGKHRSLSSGGMRCCLPWLFSPRESAHKLQPGPNLPQCHLCHGGLVGPPLRRRFKIRALSPSPATADPHQLRHWQGKN